MEPSPEQLRQPPTPHVRVLGAVEIVDGDGVVRRLRGRIAQLLGVLVEASPRGVQRPDLAELLWRGTGPEDPGAALDPMLSRLRRLVGPIDGRGEVRLVELLASDVAAGRAALIRARAAWPSAPEQALAAGSEAVEWLADEFLPGVDEPWIAERRRRLALDRDEARGLVARAALALGGAALPCGHAAAAALVITDPLDEEGYELLMRCQLAAGREGSAVGTFERARAALAGAHQTQPGSTLQQLHDQASRAQVAQRGTGTTVLPTALERERRTPLVGRSAELEAVMEACSTTQSAGGLVVIHGRAGIGKTRLLAEAGARFVAAGGAVLHGQALEIEPLPFGALGHALRPVIGALPADRVEGPNAAAAAAVRFRAFERVREAVQAAALRAPSGRLLLLLDDAQWLDRSSGELLAHLLRGGGSGALHVALGTRDPLAPAISSAQRAARLVSLVALAGESPLLRRSAQELGATITDTAGLERATAAALGRAELAVRQLVQLVAVGGDGVENAVLASVLGCSPSEVEAIAASARTHGVLDPPAAESQVGRLHDARRQAVLATVDGAAIRSAHRSIAGALEQRVDDAGDPEKPHVWLREQSARLADHWRRAGGLVGLRRAGSYAADAAEAAFAGLAFEQCALLAAQARLDMRGSAALGAGAPGAQPLSDGELGLLLLEGHALNAASALESARPVWLEAIEEARSSGTAEQEAIAVLGLAGPRLGGALRDGELRRALEHALQRPLENPALQARLRSRLAGELVSGPVDRRRALADDAIQRARKAGSGGALAESLLSSHLVLLGDADLQGREELLDEVDRVARAAGRLDLALHARMARFGDLVEQGQIDSAAAELACWEEEAEAAQLPYNRWAAAVCAPTIALAHGDLSAAIAALERARVLAAPLGDDLMVQSATAGQQLTIALMTGQHDLLRSMLTPLASGAEALTVWSAALAYTEAIAGQDDRALELLASAIERGALSAVDALRLPTLSFLATVAVVSGASREDCAALRAALEPHAGIWATQHYGSATHGPVVLQLALLDLQLGAAATARQRVVAFGQDPGASPPVAVEQLLRDRVEIALLYDAGRRAEAGELAKRAAAKLEAQGVIGWAELLRRGS